MFFFRKSEPEVALPLNADQLDHFVDTITRKFSLPDGEDTYDAIATMIMHLPSTRHTAPLSYFGHSVLKSLANKAAYMKLRELARMREEKDKAEKEAQKALAAAEQKLASAPEQPTEEQNFSAPEILTNPSEELASAPEQPIH